MPESKKRKPTHHAHQDFIPHEKKKKSVIPYTMLFFALFAAGIALFAVGKSAYWIVAISILIGLAVGYYAGQQVDQSFASRNKS